MAKHIVQCRICKEKFDAQPETKDTIWVMPQNKFYYHKDCYEKWHHDKGNINAIKEDSEWIGYIWDFLSRDLKVSYDYLVCKRQMESFVEKQNCTYKGIFFALKYFYEIKKNDWKKDNPNKGVGIVPYIYKESCEYWAKMLNKQKDILVMIEHQMKKWHDAPTIQPGIKKKKKKKFEMPWEEIEASADE